MRQNPEKSWNNSLFTLAEALDSFIEEEEGYKIFVNFWQLDRRINLLDCMKSQKQYFNMKKHTWIPWLLERKLLPLRTTFSNFHYRKNRITILVLQSSISAKPSACETPSFLFRFALFFFCQNYRRSRRQNGGKENKMFYVKEGGTGRKRSKKNIVWKTAIEKEKENVQEKSYFPVSEIGAFHGKMSLEPQDGRWQVKKTLKCYFKKGTNFVSILFTFLFFFFFLFLSGFGIEGEVEVSYLCG